jgi:acetyl-CoA C-acetyltransferase
MREAVIVAAKRTPIGKTYRGAFNHTYGPTLGAHAIRAVVEQAGIDPAMIDDVVMGCAMRQGATGFNIARLSALRAGLPVSVAGMTIDRQCSSGLMAVATAAKYITHDGAAAAIGAGVETVSLVQNKHINRHMGRDP